MSQPAPSYQDLYNIALAELVSVRPELQVLEGDITDAMLSGIAAAADADIRQSAREFADTFLDTAEGAALTKLADDRYQVQRVEATDAVGEVTITRTSGGAAETLIAGTRVATTADASGAQAVFVLDDPAVFGLGANGPVTVSVTAVASGVEANVAAGAIAEFVDRPDDSTFVVTNDEVTAGGGGEESDDSVRDRCRAFFATLRRGTMDALEFGARLVPQVRNANAVESTSGLVTVYVSDEDGNSNAEMVNLVIAELENWRAAGVVIAVVGAAIFEQDVTYSIIARAGVTVDTTLANAAIAGAMNKQRAGEILYRTTLRAAVKALNPDGIREVLITLPATDIEPAGNQIIRPGTITEG